MILFNRMDKKIHREITQLTSEDSFLVFNRVKDDFDCPIHFHPNFELNFIENGKGVRRIVGDNIEEIGDFELVLVGHNLIHCWELHNCKNKEIHEITIHIQDNLLDKNLLSRKIFKPIKDLLDKSKHGILFSEEITREMIPRLVKLSKISGIEYFLEFVSVLYDLSNSKDQRLLSTYTAKNENFENSDRIKKVHDYIYANYGKKISLSEISELINMSAVTFNRFIKKRTGRTFITYLNDVRISFAVQFLIDSNLSVSEIGYKCGFNNIANFNRIFKKGKKCTPREFRHEFSKIKGVQRVL